MKYQNGIQIFRKQLSNSYGYGMQKLTFNTKIGNQMQNPYCRNVRNVKFPKIVAEKFAFYRMGKSYPCRIARVHTAAG